MKKIIIGSGILSLIIGLTALIVLLLQGPGYQAGWWGLGTAFRSVFPKVVMAGGLAILLGTIGIIGFKIGGKKPALMGLIGLVAGLSAAMVPISIKNTAGSLPMIHDISTDTQNPPQFVATAKMRTEGMNPAAYDPAISVEQKQAYPDIVTIEIPAPRAEVFNAAVNVVKSSGWELVEQNEMLGLIEATETTTWFGFKDDVVIRVVHTGDKTQVDVRSKSRIGKSDLGVNAKRIRHFRESLLSKF
jgi:uncharacterized protein (DUF1499 family)